MFVGQDIHARTFFYGIHLDEHQELHLTHLFINFHGRLAIDEAATQEEDQSQDHVPQNATSVKVNIQSWPGKHPYTVPVAVKATTTVKDVLVVVATFFPVLSEQKFLHTFS